MSQQAKSKLIILSVVIIIVILIGAFVALSSIFVNPHPVTIADSNGWSEQVYDETQAKPASVINVQNPQTSATAQTSTTATSTSTTSTTATESKSRIIVSVTLIRPTKDASIQVCVTGNVGLFSGVYSASRTYCSGADVLTASFNYGSDITVSANSNGYPHPFKEWRIYRGLPSSTTANTPSSPIVITSENPTKRLAETSDLFIFAEWEGVNYDGVTLTIAQGVGRVCAQGFDSLGTTIIYDCVENNYSAAVSKTLNVPDGLKLIITAQGTQYNFQGPYFRFNHFESNIAMSDTNNVCTVNPPSNCEGATIVYAVNNGYVYAYFTL